jgi:hypothetical protein
MQSIKYANQRGEFALFRTSKKLSDLGAPSARALMPTLLPKGAKSGLPTIRSNADLMCGILHKGEQKLVRKVM